ncbi:MAG: FtsW/RodA/SpoVE family cell cycle protein [Proteobacteria bacterium]|nr:FtsW/RodA/SpoVE family cell cycle protein [Candidatus Enterousia onthequi]MCQ2580690.1 FtsW/RodA/SpoVE family cell cycle protein [Alphaproteobacteria bacterium]
MAVINEVARRTDDSKLTDWYFGTDRWLLLYVGIMIFVGMIAAISTGSANSIRVHGALPWYYFFVKMFPFYIVGLGTLFITSMFNKKWVLNIAWLNIIVCLPLLIMTFIHPQLVNGSARWVVLGGLKLMPSDIMKPGFVVITAWFLARMKEKYGDNIFLNREAWKFNWMSWWPYIFVFCLTLGIMFKQPDVGTSMLYFLVLGIMLFVAGLPKRIVAILGGILVGGGTLAFFLWHHVHERIMDFFQPLDPLSQVGFAVNAIRQGGLFGMGDEAFAAENLPMAENDFVYAALVEDFGALAGCLLLVLFIMVIKRLMQSAASARDKFVLYVITGTTALFSVQICLNLATTLHVMPPKGMTLPFISFGGSSFLGFCLLFGMTLALIREDKWK